MKEFVGAFRTAIDAAIAEGRVLMGPSVGFTDPMVTLALAESADFIWLDLEHAPMDPSAVTGHLLAARAADVPMIVRVPGSATHLIKPLLDAGAGALVVPQVRSAEEVRGVVADCRYPPMGRRGYGPRVPSHHARLGGPDFVRSMNESVFIAVQIENAEALAELDQILAVPGLDSVFIGPVDLSGSLGALDQIDDPRVVAAMDEIIAKARAAGVIVGAGLGDADHAARMAQKGVQWIQLSGDALFVHAYYELLTAAVHEKLRAAEGARNHGS